MRWAKLGVAALMVLGAVMFVMQNSARTTELSFDIGVAAWKLAAPVPVPVLMGVCAAGGGLLVGVLGLASRVRLQRRVRQLEQEMALRGTPAAPDGGGWA
jgi:uncharacterized integral membrane protein